MHGAYPVRYCPLSSGSMGRAHLVTHNPRSDVIGRSNESDSREDAGLHGPYQANIHTPVGKAVEQILKKREAVEGGCWSSVLCTCKAYSYRSRDRSSMTLEPNQVHTCVTYSRRCGGACGLSIYANKSSRAMPIFAVALFCHIQRTTFSARNACVHLPKANKPSTIVQCLSKQT